MLLAQVRHFECLSALSLHKKETYRPLPYLVKRVRQTLTLAAASLSLLVMVQMRSYIGEEVRGRECGVGGEHTHSWTSKEYRRQSRWLFGENMAWDTTQLWYLAWLVLSLCSPISAPSRRLLRSKPKFSGSCIPQDT